MISRVSYIHNSGHVIQGLGPGTCNPWFTFGHKICHCTEIKLYRIRIPTSYCFVNDIELCHDFDKVTM